MEVLPPDLRASDPVLQRLVDWLRARRAVDGGSDAVSWPGGNRLTDPTTVKHGLGRAPTAISLGSASSNMALSYRNVTAQTFDVVGNTIDGTSPVATTTRTFSWHASV